MYPEVRLTIDSMRHTIINHMGTFFDQQKGAIKEAVDRAVEAFDFQAEVARIVDGEVKRQLQEMARLVVRSALFKQEEKFLKLAQEALVVALKDGVR
jgi:capsid protein